VVISFSRNTLLLGVRQQDTLELIPPLSKKGYTRARAACDEGLTCKEHTVALLQYK